MLMVECSAALTGTIGIGTRLWESDSRAGATEVGSFLLSASGGLALRARGLGGRT